MTGLMLRKHLNRLLTLKVTLNRLLEKKVLTEMVLFLLHGMHGKLTGQLEEDLPLVGVVSPVSDKDNPELVFVLKSTKDLTV